MAEGGKVSVDDGKSTDGKKKTAQLQLTFCYGKCHMIIISRVISKTHYFTVSLKHDEK